MENLCLLPSCEVTGEYEYLYTMVQFIVLNHDILTKTNNTVFRELSRKVAYERHHTNTEKQYVHN